ncbi:helix-turn-helix transcriptional regulator [Uliginosibacterium sediminicola]|uniref:helix-turn-helix transcriptional regulator n=1 Tax=Uliginosibacterium sediminicola TaxID=2024550 RepID=UPI003D0B2B9F
MTDVAIKPLYYSLETVSRITTLGKSQIQKMVANETFPKPRLISGRRVAWLAREVDQWCDSRPIANLMPPPAEKAKQVSPKDQKDE